MTMYDLKDEVVEVEDVRDICTLTLKNVGAGAVSDLMSILVSARYITEVELTEKSHFQTVYTVRIKERQL